MPRWSTAMTSKSRASAGITRRQAYQVSGQPCTSSSGGPSPPMTACRRSSPVSMYRLVNVSVNPAGRFGAPETEPGPCGTGSGADELMRISFQGPDGQVVWERRQACAWSPLLAPVGALVCTLGCVPLDWPSRVEPGRLCPCSDTGGT